MSSVHTATIEWQRGESRFDDRLYSRAHRWRFDGGAVLAASSSPHVVRPPLSDPAGVDPEEAYVAALSSCHMLWFLDLAARAGYVVDRYVDHARGHMADRGGGRLWIATVELSPDVSFAGTAPDRAQLAALHHQAHEECYLAASVRTDIRVLGGENG
jgi:organic hydroperoxide reductase OsmC/OhrA